MLVLLYVPTASPTGDHVVVHVPIDGTIGKQGYYIDITATQFDNHNDAVVIMTADQFQHKEEWYWQPVEFFNTDIDLYEWQKGNYWPDDQLCIQKWTDKRKLNAQST